MSFVVEFLRFLGANYSYILAGMLSIVFVVTAYFAKHSLAIASFAYAVTRVRVMSGRMLKQNKLRELAESYAVSDVIAAFEGSAYEPYVAGKEKLEEIEHGLALSLAEDYQKIREMSPKRAKPLFDFMSARYDIENIKKILAAKVTKEPVKALMPSTMSKAFLQKLIDAETLEEALELLKSTHYGKILKELPSDATIEKIERSLEKYLYEELLCASTIERVAKKAGIMKDSFYLKEIFGIQNDIINIKTALRFIREGASDKEMQDALLGKGFYLTERVLTMLSDARELQAAINALQGTPYYSIMNDALRSYAKEKSLYVFEKALDEFYVARIRSISLKQPFGLTPLVCYLLLKEHEIKSIGMILNCIKEGLPKEKIKELFIGA
jgi:V/A-type H+-transporting ATPase subunit C